MDKYLKTADNDWYRQRVFGAIILALTAFALIFLRLIYLQVIMGDEYRRLSVNNSIRLQSIEPPRGVICDRNGKVLVDNRPSFDVNIILKDARPFKETLHKLAEHLDVPPQELLSKLSKGNGISSYKPILLKQDIGRNALATVEGHKYDLPGIAVNVKLRRHYLNLQSAAHIIGYLSEINSGELEQRRLSGTPPG